MNVDSKKLFCNNECIEINESDNKKILKEINNYIEFDKCFPGPQPSSIERKDFKTLFKNDYMISHKADGLRFLLVCMKYNNLNICLLIDRNMQMKLIPLKMSKEFYKGTFIDGELIKVQNQYEFLCFDILKLSNEDVSNTNFNERMKYIDVFVDNIKYREKDCFKIMKKEFYKYDKTPLPKSYYDTDGYVMMPINEKIIYGTHKTFYKWKPSTKNTVDFYINDKYKLCLIKNNQMYVTRNNLIPNIQLEPNFVYECELCTDTKKWKPIIKRTDKSTPNSHYVYKKTCLNIQENITESELFNIIP